MWRRMRVAFLVWLAMVGADFVLNAAFFARMYQQGDPFLLPPREAFARIPLGYLAFAVLAVAIVELASRLRISDARGGLRLGTAAGAALAASWSLGLYSVATLSAEVALGFAVIWLALLAMAGAVAGAGLGRASLRGLALRVVGADLLGAAVVIALQSFGVVPTIKL